MAPGTRRANRSGYAEHDDFEGLPVRQWRQGWVNVAPPQPQEPAQQNDIWAIELIHGMPKDSGLLAPHSQELLRAARSGLLYKRPADEDEPDADMPIQSMEKTERREEETVSQGFSIKLWKQIPRSSEGSTLSHLAKRRKGTVTIASRTVEEKTSGPTVTRATVRRLDAAGNPYTEEVTLAEGQQVVGEIISTRVEVAPAPAADKLTAPLPLPQRRRPPPPKRKPKAGPGRGKKKHLVKNPSLGGGLAAGAVPTLAGPPGTVKTEIGGFQEGSGTPNPDSEMADGDDDDDDDEGDDVDEGDDEDQEDGDHQGDDADDSKLQDAEMTDAAEEPKPPTPGVPVTDGITAEKEAALPPNAPPIFTPALAHLASNSPKAEGSPLKNVMLQSPPRSQVRPVMPTAVAELPPASAAALEAFASPLPAPLLPAGANQPMSGAVKAEPPRTESLICEPPSTLGGDEDDGSVDADVLMTETPAPEDSALPVKSAEESGKDEAPMAPSPRLSPPADDAARDDNLLPPPPEYVGNVSSPKADDAADASSDLRVKSRDGLAADSSALAGRPPLYPRDSVMTEDTIKPEDSASVSFPLTEPDAPPEVETASLEDSKDSAVAVVAPAAEAPRDGAARAGCPPPEPSHEPEENQPGLARCKSEPKTGGLSPEAAAPCEPEPTAADAPRPHVEAVSAPPGRLPTPCGDDALAEPHDTVVEGSQPAQVMLAQAQSVQGGPAEKPREPAKVEPDDEPKREIKEEPTTETAEQLKPSFLAEVLSEPAATPKLGDVPAEAPSTEAPPDGARGPSTVSPAHQVAATGPAASTALPPIAPPILPPVQPSVASLAQQPPVNELAPILPPAGGEEPKQDPSANA